MSGLVLTPFTEEATSLAQELHSLVRGSAKTLTTDFPQVVSRYRTPRTAEQSVAQVIAAMQARNGEFGAFAVRQNDRLIGVATYDQMELHLLRGVWPFRYRKVAVTGPLLALWLGTEHRQPLLPAILNQAAYELRKMPGLSGWAHTLVRPEQRKVLAILGDQSNAFGGFTAQDHSASWDGDGVKARRLLMVARRSVSQLPVDRRGKPS